MSKCIFGMFFLLGSICLAGALITKLSSFAIGGYLLLIFGTLVNVITILWLLIYGLIYRPRLSACLKAVGILMINIPIAVIYALIGLNLN
ncbi:hypothetical protein LF887_02675 [Chryseobacterium sp. MEBOG06]|uniref:hypothetical protein n=1 Tax=Chryseobacterium sp. MEBOG06 TaxID=2879938 RepID=UPI001F26FF48|nr:hypothetical protein [Chryseobacterium sp. MEBOG06]UKB84577.1 hypothetical protein LF887_02675 [Chryseobacterium sp. MEBOG06]